MRTDWSTAEMAGLPPRESESAPQVEGWLTALRKGDVGRAFGEMGQDAASFSVKTIPYVGGALASIFGSGGGPSGSDSKSAGLPPWVVPAGIGVGVVALVLLLRPSSPAVVVMRGSAN